MNEFYENLRNWCEDRNIKWPACNIFSATRKNIFYR